MNKNEVVLDVLQSLLNRNILWQVRKAIFEIYPGEYVYLKGEGPINLDDFYLFSHPRETVINYENILIDRSLIGHKGKLALNEYEKYKLRSDSEISVQKLESKKIKDEERGDVMKPDSAVYLLQDDVKMAVFYGEKSASIEGSNWSLNAFLGNKETADIVKVSFYQGNTKENDCYHVFYKPKKK